jgi:hypothetical protein
MAKGKSNRSPEDDFVITAELIKQSMENWECSWDEAVDRLLEALAWQKEQRRKAEAEKKDPSSGQG